jgi:hypothetical protein
MVADFASVEQWQKNGYVRIICDRAVLRISPPDFFFFEIDAQFTEKGDSYMFTK